MGIRYFCDVCRLQYDVKGGFGPAGYPMSAEMLPDKWAIISYLAPKGPESEPKPSPIGLPAGRMPKGFLVCSQACAEKALDEAKEHLRQAFEKS